MINELFTRWPVVRQILTHSDGTGTEAMGATETEPSLRLLISAEAANGTSLVS